MKQFILVYILCMVECVSTQAQEKSSFDIWVKGGMVLDGSGAPATRADVFIKGNHISFIGHLKRPFSAKDTLNASGKIVSPGFIDSHAHGLPFETPNFKNFTSMGVTTIALGQDGSSPNTSDVRKLIENMDTLELGPNIALFIGHGTIRKLSGIGFKRDPSEDEIQKMCNLLAEGMSAGAFGMTTGLEYTPGRYANQNELDALAKVVGQYDGLIMSHMRTENNATMDSDLAELFSQGKYANIQVSHMKVVYGKGKERAQLYNNWNPVS